MIVVMTTVIVAALLGMSGIVVFKQLNPTIFVRTEQIQR